MAPQESVMRDLKPRRSWDGTTAVAGPATQSCQQVTLSAPRHRPPSTGMDQAHVKAREQHRLCPGGSGQAMWWFWYQSRAAISSCLLLQGLDQPHGSSLCSTTLPTASSSSLFLKPQLSQETNLSNFGLVQWAHFKKKNNIQVFSSWQGTFSPQLQQPREMVKSKGRPPHSWGLRSLTLSPGFAVCLPLPC